MAVRKKEGMESYKGFIGPEFDTNVEILGHIQRGGAPSAFDRILASEFGAMAIYQLLQGNSGLVIATAKSDIISLPIEEALAMKKGTHHELIKIIKLVNR